MVVQSGFISSGLDGSLLSTKLELSIVVDPEEEHNECDDNNDVLLSKIFCEIQG